MPRRDNFDGGHGKPEHFGAQFGMSKAEEGEMAGEAMGQHLMDGIARIEGYHDYEHMKLEKNNIEDALFEKRYKTDNPEHGRTGNVVYDPDIESTVYEIKHPSGWKAVHRGMITDLHHPKHGCIDLIDWNDSEKHGLGSPATPDEWPSPEAVHAELNDWIEENKPNYPDM